jgi:hypothetical protein
VVFTAIPETGYKIKEWYVDGIAQNYNNEIFTLPNIMSDIIVSIEFELIPTFGNFTSAPGTLISSNSNTYIYQVKNNTNITDFTFTINNAPSSLVIIANRALTQSSGAKSIGTNLDVMSVGGNSYSISFNNFNIGPSNVTSISFTIDFGGNIITLIIQN